MINPKRENRTYLIYAEDEGAEFKILGDFTLQEWLRLEHRGWFEWRPGDYRLRVYPAFATLVTGVDNRDFRIDELNGTRKEIPRGKRVRSIRHYWRRAPKTGHQDAI